MVIMQRVIGRNLDDWERKLGGGGGNKGKLLHNLVLYLY